MILTKRQWDVLEIMHLHNEEIVMEGREVWIGEEKSNVALVYALLRECLISADDYSDIRYHINETGRNAVTKDRYTYKNEKYFFESPDLLVEGGNKITQRPAKRSQHGK